MFGAIPRDSPGYDLTSVGYVIFKNERILILDLYFRIGAESAKFSLVVKLLLLFWLGL